MIDFEVAVFLALCVLVAWMLVINYRIDKLEELTKKKDMKDEQDS